MVYAADPADIKESVRAALNTQANLITTKERLDAFVEEFIKVYPSTDPQNQAGVRNMTSTLRFKIPIMPGVTDAARTILQALHPDTELSDLPIQLVIKEVDVIESLVSDVAGEIELRQETQILNDYFDDIKGSLNIPEVSDIEDPANILKIKIMEYLNVHKRAKACTDSGKQVDTDQPYKELGVDVFQQLEKEDLHTFMEALINPQLHGFLKHKLSTPVSIQARLAGEYYARSTQKKLHKDFAQRFPMLFKRHNMGANDFEIEFESELKLRYTHMKEAMKAQQ